MRIFIEHFAKSQPTIIGDVCNISCSINYGDEHQLVVETFRGELLKFNMTNIFKFETDREKSPNRYKFNSRKW